MQDLQGKLDMLDNNVKALVRKLNESVQKNHLLQQENNKLKQGIQEFELRKSAVTSEVKNSKTASKISEEQYQNIKSDIQSAISEIDECIELMEK